MPRRRTFAVALFFLLEGGFVSWVAGSERLPPVPALDRFPSTLGAWTKTGEQPIDAATAAQLQADRLLNWNYMQAQTAVSADWFVAWFQTQRHGAQPHSPKVCLPGNGWIPEVSDQVSIPTAVGTIEANRMIVTHGPVRAVVIYWFETPRRAIASEWAAKLWLVADAVRDRRTDTAVARIVVFEAQLSDADATAAAVQFAQQAYPALRAALPGSSPD
jgi:EpsI family protein